MAAGGLLLLLVACGSTVPVQQVENAGADPGLGGDTGGDAVATGSEGSAIGDGAGGTSSASADGRTGATGGRGAAATGAGSGSRTTSTLQRSGAGSSTKNARGVSDKEIKIGVEYTVDAGAVVGAFGAKGVSSNDWKAEYQLAIDEVNERGGILGRRIVPIWQGYRFEGDWATQEKAACTKFTEDEKVFAVIAFAHGDAGLSCLEKAGLPQIVTGGFFWFDEKTFRTYPRLLQAPGLTLDRMAVQLADGLVKHDYFADNAVIGVVSHESDMWERGYKVLEARLATYGRSVKYTMRLPEFHTARDGQEFGQKLQNEMGKMRAAGVDHVIFLQQTITGAMLFMGYAGPQLWYPRYGLTTNDGPHALLSVVPDERQFHGAVGVGFSPSKDVGSTLDAPGAKRCLDYFAKREVTWKDESAKGQSVQRCDHVWALAEAIAAGGEPISTASAMTGLGRLGTSYATTTALSSDYRNGRRDGAGSVRLFAYAEECTCFRYTGGPIPVG